MTNQARYNLVEKQVVEFRKYCGLSTTEAIQMKSLLLKLNVLTLYRPLSTDFSGMSIKDTFGNRFALINSNDPIGRQHFTIAHELYHLFIEKNPKPHVCSSEGKKSESEKCADLFASLLLMPSDGIMQMLSDTEASSKTLTMATIVRLEHYFSVSRTAILNRLCDLKLISKSVRENMFAVSAITSAREFGYDTSLYKKGNENLIIGKLGEKAKNLFDKGLISEGHYIEVLNKLNYDEEN